MKKRKKRNLQGTVLFTTVSVMALLILFLVGTLTLASASNNRAHKSYSTSQASYTARATIEGFTQAMVREPGVAAAVYNLSNTPGTVMYPAVVVDDSTIGRVGCYDTVTGEWKPNTISVESVEGNDFVYRDKDGRSLGDTSFDTASGSWIRLDKVKISAVVRVGREEETVVAYLAKRGDKSGTLTSSSPQVKGIQLVGAEALPAGENVTGGLGVALGEVEDDVANGIRNNMDIDTTLSFFNSSMVWKTNTTQINIKKPDLKDEKGNPVAPTLPYSQTVINGNLTVRNDKFINIDYDPPADYRDGQWSNKEVPYLYVDGALYADSQFNVNDLRNNGAPFNIFAGTLYAKDMVLNLASSNLYLMDSPPPRDANATKPTYTVYTDYNTETKTASQEKTIVKGDNYFGLNSTSKLGKWSYAVANGTYTSAYDVGGNIFCKGDLHIGNANVAGDVRVEGDCYITGKDGIIEGRLVVGGRIINEVTYDPHFTVESIVRGGVYNTSGAGITSYTQGGVSIGDYINSESGEVIPEADDNGNVTRENFYVPAGKVDPFALEEVTPNAYGAIEYFKWRPDDHLNADGNPVDVFGNADIENPSAIRYYFWKDTFETGMFPDDMIKKYMDNEEFNHASYDDAMNDPDFTSMRDYLVNEPYTEVNVPFNQYDGSSDHYFGTPSLRDDGSIFACGTPSVENEKYFYNIDEGQIWTQSYIDTLDEIEEHYIRAKIDGTRSTERAEGKYTHYIGGDPNHFTVDDDPATDETAPVTTAPVETTTTVAEVVTTATPVINTSLPSDMTEIYPSDMQREKIYGYYRADMGNEFYVEPTTKIITNVKEARHALGLQPSGKYDPKVYPTKYPEEFKVAPTEPWDGGVITKSCVISGNVSQEITVKPDSDIYILLDNVTLTDHDIVVDTIGPKQGVVYFIVRGDLTMYRSCIRPMKYVKDLSYKYTEDWGIVYYGTQDSNIVLWGPSLLVGSLKMPATKFKSEVEGAHISVVYTDETGREIHSGTDVEYPSIVGNAILDDLDAKNKFVNYYTASGFSGSDTDETGTPINTAVGDYSVLYMLGS